VAALVECKGTKSFLAATRALPEVGARSVLYDSKTREAVSPEEHARLAPEEQARFQATSFDPEFYYTTRYGTPIARARGRRRRAAASRRRTWPSEAHPRLGYGGIGHLRPLASLGCDVVGVEVDPLLRVYYGASDQLDPGRERWSRGRAEARARTLARRCSGEGRRRGGLRPRASKNVPKKGYVRFAQKVDPWMLVDLGDTARVPGRGRARPSPAGSAICNLCLAQRATARSPGLWRVALHEGRVRRGRLRAARLDVDDRAQAQELGWG
jgi:hypothetical protein